MSGPKKVLKMSGLLGSVATPPSAPPPVADAYRPIDPLPDAGPAQGAPAVEEAPQWIPLGLIDRSPYQNRSPATDEKVAALAAEILRHGLNNPPVVRPVPGGRYELVAGETRVAAYRLNGEGSIPAYVRPMGDGESASRLVLDNFYHAELTDYEIYKGLVTLKTALKSAGKTGSLAEVAELTPWGKSQVHRLMSFAKLPQAALDILERSPNTLGSQAASDLARVAESGADGQDAVNEAVRAVLDGRIEQGRAAEWAAESISTSGVATATPAAGKASERPAKSVRAVSVDGGRLACTVERTPKGFTIKAGKGVDLSGIEDELVEWLAGRLAKDA